MNGIDTTRIHATRALDGLPGVRVTPAPAAPLAMRGAARQ